MIRDLSVEKDDLDEEVEESGPGLRVCRGTPSYGRKESPVVL